MAARVLTVQAIERMKPDAQRRLEVPDATLPGLYFVLQPSGAKSWAVRYRHQGRTRKMTLGTYPALDLASARAKGREAIHTVSLGQDPAAERAKVATKPEPARDLVSSVVDTFIERHAKVKNRPRTAEETARLLRNRVVPAWGDKRIHEVTRRDIVVLLDAVVDGGHPIAANRTLAALSKLFNWATDRGLIDANPCARVKAPSPETSRDRVLDDAEIALVWRGCDAIGGPFGPFVRLLLLTGQRRDEVAKMRRVELSKDGLLWTVPADRAKNGQAHDVPLIPEARAVLSTLPQIRGKAGFVITTTGESAVSGYATAKSRLDAAMLKLAQDDAERAGEGAEPQSIPPWRFHDLRRTVATGMARLGQPPHVVEAVLNHRSGTISGVAAIYNRHQYLEEKRAALEAWGRHVAALTGAAR